MDYLYDDEEYLRIMDLMQHVEDEVISRKYRLVQYECINRELLSLGTSHQSLEMMQHLESELIGLRWKLHYEEQILFQLQTDLYQRGLKILGLQEHNS